MPSPLESASTLTSRRARCARRMAAVALAGLALLAGGAVMAQQEGKAAGAKQASGPVGPEAMVGLDFNGIVGERLALAVSVLNGHGCDCGCGMTLARCRRDDSTCGKSLALGRQILTLVRQGKSREQIVGAVLAPPSKHVQFPIDPAGAPAIGADEPTVRILHYIDYQ